MLKFQANNNLKNHTPTPHPTFTPKRETSEFPKITLNNKGGFFANPKDIATKVNNYFCSVAPTIQSNVKQTFKPFHHYLTDTVKSNY